MPDIDWGTLILLTAGGTAGAFLIITLMFLIAQFIVWIFEH